jgi:hypothetical protein
MGVFPDFKGAPLSAILCGAGGTMKTQTFRALCWINPKSGQALPLTDPRHRNMDRNALFEIGTMAASQRGLPFAGRVEIIPFTGDHFFESDEVLSMQAVTLQPDGSLLQRHRVGYALCEMMTIALADGLARVVRPVSGLEEFTHVVELSAESEEGAPPMASHYLVRLGHKAWARTEL